MADFSLAKDRAGAYFNNGATIFSVQAPKGVKNEKLVRAVEAGKGAFLRVYLEGSPGEVDPAVQVATLRAAIGKACDLLGEDQSPRCVLAVVLLLNQALGTEAKESEAAS